MDKSKNPKSKQQITEKYNEILEILQESDGEEYEEQQRQDNLPESKAVPTDGVGDYPHTTPPIGPGGKTLAVPPDAAGENPPPPKKGRSVRIIPLGLKTMVLNMAFIQNYYDISIKQAKISFGLAIAACALGFVLFLIAIVNLLVFHVDLSSALIPAIGGALTEILATTVFFIYKKSLAQLNLYFRSLQSNEKFLSLVSLAEKLSTDKKDEILTDIIKSRLESTAPKKG